MLHFEINLNYFQMLDQVNSAHSETQKSAMSIWRGTNVVKGFFFVLAAYVQVDASNIYNNFATLYSKRIILI